MLKHLVGTIGGPHLLRKQPLTQVVRERLAKRQELAIGVAVDVPKRQSDRIEDVGGDLVRHGMGVLVHVERHRKRCLRRTVRSHSAQIVTERKVVEASGHPSHGTGAFRPADYGAVS